MPDTITNLIASLDSPDKKVRRDAKKKLKDAGKSASVPLLKALGNDSEQIRTGAAEILGTYSEETMSTFLHLLTSGSVNARDGAARTLAQMVKNGIPVIEPLSDLIGSDNYRSRRGAALAIGYIGRPDKNATSMLVYLLRDKSSDVRKQAVESLDKIKWNSESQTEQAYYYLEKEDWDALGKIGNSAVPALSFGIEISDAKKKRKIASVLAKTDDKSSNSLLKLLLNDRDGGVRQAAVAAIADKRDDSLIPLLVERMNDKDPDVRIEASWSLGKTKWRPKNYYEMAKSLMLRGSYKDVENMGEPAIPCLIEFLGNDIYDVRQNTYKILYKLGKPGTDAVNNALSSSNPDIQNGAAEALAYIREEIIKAQEKEAAEFLNKSEKSIKKNSPEYWEEKLLIAGFGTEMSLRFSKNLSNEDPIIRIVAIESLKKFGTTSITVLIALTEDINENVEIAAIEALGELYAKEAIPCLLETIEEESEGVRRASAYSLGKIRDTGTIPVLIRHFADPEESVRYESARAVAKMGNSAIPFIENMAFHPNELVRISSLHALGEISDPYGIPLATRSLNDSDSNVRNEAMEALFKISNFMFNYLMVEVHRVSVQGTKMEKLGMLSVLSKTADMKIVPYVKEYLADDDEEIKRNARTILDIFTERVFIEERGRIREYSRETADLLRRKLTLNELDRLLDRVLNANDSDALEILKKKLNQEEIDELIRNSRSSQKGDTSKLLGKKLSQEDIDELLHRSVYVENKNTTTLLSKKLSQEEIDNLIKHAGSEKDEQTAKDIKKQLTQNEIDSIIKKELELQKKIAMEVSRLIVGLRSDDVQLRSDYADKIIEMGEPAVEPLISAINNSDSEFQNLLSEILIRTGKPGIRGMIRILSYGRSEIKIVIAKNIARCGDKEANDALYDRIYSEKDPDVKKVLVESFGGLSDKRVFEILKYAMSDPNPQIRVVAVKKLGALNDERAIDPLILLFDDSNQEIREMAVSALKSYGEKAQDSLISALKSDKNDSYKETAAATLEKMDMIPDEKEDLIYFNIAKNNWKEVIKSEDIAVSPLFEILKDPYSQKRMNALNSLIKIETEKTIYPISYALFDMDEVISKKAREALLKLGGAALPQLRLINSTGDDIYQKEILTEIINEIEEKEKIELYISENRWEDLEKTGLPALTYLSNLLSDKDSERRLNATRTIGKIGPPDSVISLIEALFNSDNQVSALARAYLIKYGTSALSVLHDTQDSIMDMERVSALNSIVKEIEQNERIKKLILSEKWNSLKKEGLPALKALRVLMNSKNPEKRLNAIKVISEIHVADSIPILAKALFDEDIRVSETAKNSLLNHGSRIIPILTHIEKNTGDKDKKDAISAIIYEIENPVVLEEEILDNADENLSDTAKENISDNTAGNTSDKIKEDLSDDTDENLPEVSQSGEQ
ncbi:MAG: HEAT repeat domain-containing protein [Methanomicrobiaceae archaeon]|nr:HEAT repeat domain-containing protein [Methanomicrobiaceae archaeon]